MKTDITFTIDTDRLSGYTDTYLAQLWHIGQANPAPSNDHDAGHLAERIGREIIRRWLTGTGPELYSHQGHSHYWSALAIGLNCRFKDGVWTLPTEAEPGVTGEAAP